MVSFETKRDGAGHNYVVDMLVGWRSQHKHHTDRPKAVGIVDGDAADSRRKFNEQPDNIRSAKCFCYPTPTHLHAALAAGFKVPVTLESLYPASVWDDALNADRLERRDATKIYPDILTKRILFGEAQPGDGIDPGWAVFVNYDFKSEHKIPTARRLALRDQPVCERDLSNFRAVLDETLRFLGIPRQ
jgi:hypothetical protein